MVGSQGGASLPVKRPLLLGHRGVRDRGFKRLTADHPPENSPAAFEYALLQGCDGFEFDVRYTRDGRDVLWHDPEWNSQRIAATNYRDLADRSGHRLACLEDAVRQFGSRAYLDIELKEPGGEDRVLAALQAAPPQNGFVVSSFLPKVLLRIRELDRTVPLGFICDRDEAMAIWRQLPIKVFLPRHDMVTAPLVEETHRCGLEIMTWTVNSSRQMRQLADWGVEGLISDIPELLYQTFHSV
jgi:glycerophosphoryl diester phosphodiesterase